MVSKISVLLILVIDIILAESTKHNNTIKDKSLVLLDDWHYLESHSMFWDQLRSLNIELDFKMIHDQSIQLTYYGEYIYDNIIFFAPSFSDELSKKNDLRISNIIKFIDSGHDIMIFANSEVSNYMRKLANEFGVDFDDYDSKVRDSLYFHQYKDHLNQKLVDLKSSDIIVTKNSINVPVVSKRPKGYILYEGIAMEIDPHNQYLFPVLKADDNSYSVNTKSGNYYNFGDKIKLVNAYQARNNRRVVISGSTNLCSNKFYHLSATQGVNARSSPNAEFCNEIINWNFQKSGVIKYENVRHYRKEDGATLSTYRIKDEIDYLIDIYEYDSKNNLWKPFLTDDLQVELVMLNPYIRTQLKLLSNNKPTYTLSFTAPDKHGVFKFVIDYKRLGYSYIDVTTKLPLRPFRHNEFPRYLPAAYPYYVSVIVMFSAFLLFSAIFLFSKSRDSEKVKVNQE